MTRTHILRFMAGGALVISATLLASGATIASDALGQPFDPATQAVWLQDHFCCEHAADMARVVLVDPATQAAWIHDHFCCEHAAEMGLL